jgi:phenylacetate-CoA ligase
LFTNFLQDKSIVLKDVCPTLKACVVTSEMLFKNDKTSRGTTNSINGASELDLIAFQPETQKQKGNGKSIQKLCLLKF